MGLAALMAAVCALAGCGTAPVFAPAAADAPSARPSTAAASPVGSGPLTLAFAGDVHFTGRTAGLLHDPSTAFGPITTVLSGADFTMVNLETAITERGTAEPKEFHFRAPVTAFDAVRAAGVDAVTMANNHVLDYGQVGLADTLDNARRAHYPIVGAGHNAAEAFTPLVVTVKGVKIAVLGFSQVHELESTWAATDRRAGVAMASDLARATAAVRAARSAADLVIVFNHWGREGVACPLPEEKTFAARLAAAGADVIIGAHAHTLQGSGWLGKTYVAYGMGNFLWWENSYSTDTGVLRLTMSGRQVAKADFVPATVTANGQPVPLTGAAAATLEQRYAALRPCAGLATSPS